MSETELQLVPDSLSDEERARALKELPDCGLELTTNQYLTLAWFKPDQPEVQQWLNRNSLHAAKGQTVELTVNGLPLTMKLDPEDFGTEPVADYTTEEIRQLRKETREGLN